MCGNDVWEKPWAASLVRRFSFFVTRGLVPRAY